VDQLRTARENQTQQSAELAAQLMEAQGNAKEGWTKAVQLEKDLEAEKRVGWTYRTFVQDFKAAAEKLA
jgi:hypothetical protein